MNKKIKNASSCSFNNIEFKSVLEKNFYKHLLENGFNPQYEYKTFELWEGFTPITPFFDQETAKQKAKRISNGDVNANSILVLKNTRIVGIRYTPDFYFNYKGVDIYIEAKGIENDVYYIKKKLFRYYLDKLFINNNQKSLFFEVRTIRQLKQAMTIIKNYAQAFKID